MTAPSCLPQAAAPAPRQPSVAVRVGAVVVGGGAPIVVQSMTNTDTADVDATVAQVAALARAGSEIVRITVDRDESAAAVPKIRERLLRLGLDVPLVEPVTSALLPCRIMEASLDAAPVLRCCSAKVTVPRVRGRDAAPGWGPGGQVLSRRS